MRFLSFLIFLFLFSFSCAVDAHQPPEEKNSTNVLPKTGNFGLPVSQQPGPLIGFGQNILGKNETQIFLFADDFAGVRKHFIDLIPGLLYGISDTFSIFVNVPIAVSYQQNGNRSAGFEDAFVQLEDAFYTQNTTTYQEQATIVGNITFPTGSTQKQPPTGSGSPTFFLGATFIRTYVDWFVFASPGAMLTTTHGNTKFGNDYLYQGGFGRNIANINQWMFAWMVEVDGTYTQQNRISGMTAPNSGGNLVYVTPSLWVSTPRLIFQLGAGWAVSQHLYGNQTRSTYLLAANLGWTQ